SVRWQQTKLVCRLEFIFAPFHVNFEGTDHIPVKGSAAPDLLEFSPARPFLIAPDPAISVSSSTIVATCRSSSSISSSTVAPSNISIKSRFLTRATVAITRHVVATVDRRRFIRRGVGGVWGAGGLGAPGGIAGAGGVGGAGGIGGMQATSPSGTSPRPRGYQLAPAYAAAAADLLGERATDAGEVAPSAAAAGAARAGGVAGMVGPAAGGKRNAPAFVFLPDVEESTGGKEGHSFSFSQAFAAQGPSAAAARTAEPSSSPSHFPTPPLLQTNFSPPRSLPPPDASALPRSPAHSPRASSHPVGSPSSSAAYSFSRWGGENTAGGGERLSEDRASTVPEDGPFHANPIPPFAPASTSSAPPVSPKRSAPRPPPFNEVMKASSGEGFSHDFSDFQKQQKQKQELQKQQQWKQTQLEQEQERQRQQQQQLQGQGHAGVGGSGGGVVALLPVSRAVQGPVGEMLARAAEAAQRGATDSAAVAAASPSRHQGVAGPLSSSSSPPPPAFSPTQVAHESPRNTGAHHHMLPAKPMPPMSATGGAAAGGAGTVDVDEIIKQANNKSIQRPAPNQQPKQQAKFFCC
ncbi:unnamed protein product, partial [Closterium sp. NIES-54]